MRCDGSADPTISGEINTYINLQIEDKRNESIDAVLPITKHIREVTTLSIAQFASLLSMNIIYDCSIPLDSIL